jgi:hypothetical protein
VGYVLIYLKGCYTILGKIASNSQEHRLQFSVPLEDKSPVVVEVILTENRIESFHEAMVSQEMWKVLETDIHDGKDLPENLKTELKAMTIDISQSTRKVLNLIKYCFNQIDLDENLM